MNELRTLFETKSSPKHYIGLEISGKLHLGSLILTGFKINDFIKAGIKSHVFLADWHTYINNKLNNDWDLISEISRYYEKAFTFFCPGVNVIFGTSLYAETDDYWKNFVLFSKQITLAITLRSLTIMGRTEKDALDFSQLLYPSMQSVDIKALDLDIVHAGTDQRKIHMLVERCSQNSIGKLLFLCTIISCLDSLSLLLPRYRHHHPRHHHPRHHHPHQHQHRQGSWMCH